MGIVMAILGLLGEVDPSTEEVLVGGKVDVERLLLVQEDVLGVV